MKSLPTRLIKIYMNSINSAETVPDIENANSAKIQIKLEGDRVYSAWLIIEDESYHIISQAEKNIHEIEVPTGRASLYTVNSPDSSISVKHFEIISSHEKLLIENSSIILE